MPWKRLGTIRIGGCNRRGYCSQPREGNHARHQSDSNLCSVDDGASAPRLILFWDDHTKLAGTWKLVAFMTEDIDNKVRENVYDEQAEGYLTFTAAGRVFGFATTKSGEPRANTPDNYDASRPIISYSGNYRFHGSDLAAKVDLAWDDGWPRTEELHHYRLDGDKRLVETTHVRYPNAFGSRMISILVWEHE